MWIGKAIETLEGEKFIQYPLVTVNRIPTFEC
jgi:hypothetical protein